MKKLLKLAGEARNLFFVLEPSSFFRWLWLLLVLSPKVVRSGSLGIVDEAFGESIRFRTAGRVFSLDQCPLGLVREIIGSECYLRAAELRGFREILDLGSNCGVFTLFCLANAPEARVTAVEVQPKLIAAARANIGSTGFSARVSFLNAYAGEENDFIRELTAGDPDVVRFSPEDYIAEVGECDFMKCDIEGAEYTLITPAANWLRRVKRISLEYPGSWAQGSELGDILRGHGFHVSQQPHGDLGYLQCVRQQRPSSN